MAPPFELPCLLSFVCDRVYVRFWVGVASFGTLHRSVRRVSLYNIFILCLNKKTARAHGSPGAAEISTGSVLETGDWTVLFDGKRFDTRVY